VKFPRELVWPCLALVVILAFNAVLTPGFFSLEFKDGRWVGSLIDVLNRGTPTLLVALGMTLVIATGGIDLSVGAIAAVAGAVTACLASRPEGSFLSALPIPSEPWAIVGFALLVGAVFGWFNGVLVARFGIQPIIATLILMVSGRGIAQLLADGQIVLFDMPALAQLGAGYALGLPTPVVIAALALVLCWVLARRTAFGWFAQAVGAGDSAARLAGLDVAGVKTAAYVCSGLTAALAGIVLCCDIGGADANNAGLYIELDAILAVCIGGNALRGGKFSLAGSVIGAILMQTLTTTLLTHGVPADATLMTKALLIVAVCVAQSPRWARTARAKPERGAS